MSSRSKLGRLAVSAFGPGSDTTPGATRLLFKEWDHGCGKKLLDTQDVTGGHGSLDHGVEHTMLNQLLAQPKGTLRPSVGEWRHWLPWIFNNDAADTDATASQLYTFIPTDTTLLRNVHYANDASAGNRIFLAAGCALSKATIKCDSKAAVELEVEIEGRTFTEGISFTANPADATNYSTRFVMANQSVNLNGTAMKCRSCTITVDNGIENDRFFYGTTSAGPLQTDRKVMCELTVPYGYHAALWDAGIADGGVPLTVTYAYNGASMAWTFATVRADADSFRSVVPQEDFFTFKAMCLAKFSAAATPAMQCVLTIP